MASCLDSPKVPEHTKGNTQVLSLNMREDFERDTSEYGVIYQADLDQQEQARIHTGSSRR